MHDEETQEIDMSKLLGHTTHASNVVRVDFKRSAEPPAIRWLARFDGGTTPWTFRFAAVLIVLLLCLLMI